MTSLAPSPLMVALVQATTSLPVFFLALPAGALADIVDRRRYLIGTQLWMLVTAGAPWHVYLDRHDERVAPACVHVCTGQRRGDDHAGLGGPRPGAGHAGGGRSFRPPLP